MPEKLAGINNIREAMDGLRRMEKIYIQAGRQDSRIRELLAQAAAAGIPVEELPRQRMDQIYGSGKHQGVIGLVEEYRYANLSDVLSRAHIRGEAPFLLILDGIEDPQNLGAIIRTAECAGIHGIIIPENRAAGVTPAVSRASAGAAEHMLVVKVTNLVNTIKELKNKGFWITGADIEGKSDYYATAIPKPAVLVIGSEGRGLRRLVKEHCDLLLRIPLRGKVNSLNASVAAALFIYEVLRQEEIERMIDTD